MSLQAMTGRRIPTNRAAELKQESIRSSCDDHQPASLKIEGPEAATSESSSMSGDDDQQKRSVIEDHETPPSESDESDKAFSEGIQELNDETGRTETATPVPVEVEGSESPVSEQSDQPVTLEGKPITTPYVETDLEMSELAEQMNRAIAFSAPVVASVQVRKGYMFDLEVSGPEFWRKHDDVWSNRKRKRDNCFTHEQRHGFFAADIIKYGAVDMLQPRESNLTNDIHPLYARDSFNGCEDEIYEQFLPALRLASMWMTQPICFQFWVTLAMGKREIDKTMSQRFGRLQHRIRHDVALTEEDATNVIEYIKEISENYRMSFTFQDNFKRHGATYFGGTNKVCDVGWSDSERPTDRLLDIFTKLSSDYYVAAKKLSQLKYPDLAQVLRFQFGLAVLLVHETCHAIELAHIRKRPEVVPDEAYDPQWEQWIGHEPYFYDSVRPELGLTWEMYMFGGRILPINDRVDCLHGLCVFDWPDKNAAFDPNSREVHTIPMTYIEEMFQMETWQQKFNLSKDNVWHIPRDGAKSIYLTHFTTMSYDEEQRIKDEEATEALRAATGKWEKPADKKRRTFLDGEMLVASTSSPDVGKEPCDEVKADKDRLWKAALDYLRAQPRKPDTSLQGEEDWPEWVNECLRTMGPGNLIQAGISIAQSQSEDDEVPPNKAKQSAKDEKKRNKPRKSGISNARKGEMGRHYTSAARAVGLGTGKRR